MWERLIRLRPSLIVLAFRNFITDNRLFQTALDNGYKITENDLKRNKEFRKSKFVMEKAIEINPNFIKYFESDHLQNWYELIPKAIEKGYQPTMQDLKNNPFLGYSETIVDAVINEETVNQITVDDIKKGSYLATNEMVFKHLISINPNNIIHYGGRNQEIFRLALSANNGYQPSVSDLDDYNHLGYSDDIMERLITQTQDGNLIFKYYGNNEQIYELAVSLGIDEERMIKCIKDDIYSNYFFKRSKALMMKTIEKDSSLIEYYEGKDIKVYTLAFEKGYIPTEEFCHKHRNDEEILKLIISVRPELIRLICNSHLSNENPLNLIKLAIKSGYTLMAEDIKELLEIEHIPTFNEVEENDDLRKDFNKMQRLIMINPQYVKYYIDNNYSNTLKLYEFAVELGYILDEEDEKKYEDFLYKSDVIIKKMINSKDVNYIKKYQGDNIEIFKLVLGKYNSSEAKFEFSSNYTEDENNAIINLLINHDFEIIKNNEEFISDNYIRLFKIAIQLGYIPLLKSINNNNISHINDNLLRQIIDVSEKNECLYFIFNFDLSESIKEYILKSKNIDIPADYFDLLKGYTADRVVFINNYPKFNKFLKDLDIDENKFVQYNISSNYNWLADILSIIDNGKTEEFKKVKNYFFENYYLKNIDNISDALQMKSFITILKNYVRYPELCLNVIENNTPLQGELSEKIDFLFESNDSFDGNNRPKTIDELENIDEKISNRYLSELENIDTRNIEDIKDIICRLLFNNGLYFIQDQLRIYGNTIELRQLMFDNRDNEELCDLISEMMIYMSMMESIVEADDKQYLIDMAEKIINNMKLSSKCMMLFTTFDEKMRELYSEELSSSLTALRNDISLDSLIDKTMSSECGVEVLDFSDKQYCLLGHVKSYRETIEEVVLGKSTASHHTICLSALSHRNQVYYAYNKRCDIVFGYDNIPKGSFIQSSTGNMGSNGSVKNSLEIEGLSHRTQRGTLKTSEAPTTHNSEIHCFREGIIPKYIILPGGRKPTEEEVSIAKKYGLKFAKTQNIREEIDNPKKIEDSLLEHDKTNTERIDIETIKGVRDSLTTPSHGPRKIALFTDSHALFEPTLAILEDAKKSGITEIYSLGDNIGTGPNPREVMELLDEYGVESLTGNHEIYAALGIDDPRVKEHLEHASEHATEEARRNSTWTRAQLTPEQIEKIKNNPEQRVIEIGGQKVLLTHYAYDYNTEHRLQIPDGITHTFQGHRHFRSEDSDITTLRGAGIGLNSGDSPTAFYIVLVEKPGGGFDIEKRIIQYDNKSLRYDIKASDMSSDDKEKIEGWVKK